MNKIKLNYKIQILGDLSYEQIQREVQKFQLNKEQELSKDHMQDHFEVNVVVDMPLSSFAIVP
jgi:hypothetical protein